MSTSDADHPTAFISYTRDCPEHVNRVLALCNRLRADGVDAIIDQHENFPPLGWILWMKQQIRNAQFVLAVCTETYRRCADGEEIGAHLGASYELRLIQQTLYDAAGVNNRVIPILLSEGNHENIPIELRQYTYYSVVTDEGYDDLYARLTNQHRNDKPVLGRLRSVPSRQLKTDFLNVIWNVPPRNTFFVGRERSLEELHTTFVNHHDRTLAPSVQRISGLGGIGKTQTAIEYAYRYRSQYSSGLWVNAETEVSLSSSFSEVAQILGLPDENLTEMLRIVRFWLQQNSDWLLIVDNADDAELLKMYLPAKGKGHILVTSRTPVLDSLGIPAPLELSEFSSSEALQFFCRRTGRTVLNETEQKAATELMCELGFLPLALEQAAAYLTARQSRFDDYLKSFRQHRLKLLERHKPIAGGYPASVLTTWTMNFRNVKSASNPAADVLQMSAFLEPDDIPELLLCAGGTELGSPIASAIASHDTDPVILDEMLEPLTRYSLIRRNTEMRTYSVHRLLQEVLRDKMSDRTKKQWAARIVRALALAFPAQEYGTWSQCESFLPHGMAALKHANQWHLELPETAILLNRVGSFMSERGEYTKAEKLLNGALTMRETLFGSGHPNVAATLNDLALLYDTQGHYQDADHLLRRSLKIRDKGPGWVGRDVAESLSNLALVCYHRGCKQEAETLYCRALGIREHLTSGNQLDLAETWNNLAELYRSQGRYDEAEPLYKRALKVREETLGPQHPRVATCLNNLGLLQYDRGSYEKAEGLYARALCIWERSLGHMHPRVATCLNNFALLYRAMNRYSDARRFHIRALGIWRRTLGSKHPLVAACVSGLGALCKSKGHYKRAEVLFQCALSIYEGQLEPEHPFVIRTVKVYSEMLRELSRLKEADALESRFVARSVAEASP